MKILSLGTDKSVLDPNSKTSRRIAEYKSLVEDFITLVPQDKFKIISFFHLYNQAKKIIKEANIDIVTSQDPYFLGLIAVLLGHRLHKGVEIQVHGWENGFLRKIIARYVLGRTTAIRVVSQRLKNQLINDFKIKESKITVVPVYVDTSEKNDNLKTKKNLNTIFITVGRLVPVKNIRLQIEAMKEIVKNYPTTELWIVGDGPEKMHLEKRIIKYRLAKNIKLLGWKNDLKEYYSNADAFLLTSDNEGWGLVVIEAVSYGLPIIMTDVGCAGELIKNNENGIVIPIGDKAKLAEAMRDLINNQNLRERLSVGAIEALKRLPTKDETFELYKKSWQKALL